MEHVIHITRLSSCHFSMFIMWWYFIVSGSMESVKSKNFVMLWPWWRIEADSNCAINKFSDIFPPWGLDLISESCMFDILSTISNVLRRWISWIAVIRIYRGLVWALILSTNTLSIVVWLSLYNFDGGPMGYLIYINKFLIQFWYNTLV